jgi:DNA-binding HxlR family transcriptional regulator
MQWNPYDRNCPTRVLLDRIGDRWTVLVVVHLGSGAKRYTEISKALDGISQKVLTQTLRGLERDGVVTRIVRAQVPPRVDYELTDLGRDLRETLEQLTHWAEQHIQEVLAARDTYDATPRAQHGADVSPG